QCMIDATYGSTSNRIFAIVSGQQLEMLRTNVVPIGTTVRVVCTATSYVDCTCLGNVFSPTLPATICSAKLDPTHEVVRDLSCPATMLQMGYRLSAAHFLEIYRSCYDINSQRSLFTIHKVDSGTQNPPRVGCWRKSDVVTTRPSYQAKNIYNRFNVIFNNQQNYITRSGPPYKFHRGHLAPSADFGYCDQMRATYRYFNVVAQFASVNDGNWLRIENWVRRMRDQFGKFTVCTGGLGVLELDDIAGNPTPIYLENPDLNAVPKWIYKIIRSHANPNMHYAVITYNHAENPATPGPLCRNPFACQNVGLQINPAQNSGISYCCSADDFMN
ncbi:hypothetical protein KR093_008521, partial [Drosophila rubida]